MELDRLARLPASRHPKTTGILSFLTDEGIAQVAINLPLFFRYSIIKCGFHAWPSRHPRGATFTNSASYPVAAEAAYHRVATFSSNQLLPESIFNVTGAGDTLVASILASLVRDRRGFEGPESLKKTVEDAQVAAVLTLEGEFAISPSLSL